MNEAATNPTPRPHVGPSDPDASSRRVATPTWFAGTTTVTGASASSPFVRAISARSASAASRPYPTHSTRIVMTADRTHALRHQPPPPGPVPPRPLTWTEQIGGGGGHDGEMLHSDLVLHDPATYT